MKNFKNELYNKYIKDGRLQLSERTKKICIAFSGLLIMVLPLIPSCEKVEDIDVVLLHPDITSVPETTPEITVSEEIVTEYQPPDLTKDKFGSEGLEIYHTDFRPSEELEAEIMYLINRYSQTCSLYMVNLEDYVVFGYNSDEYIPTASTIKCPYAFYCYNEIEKGSHSFDDYLLYRSGYYSSGTGVLKDNGSGSYYSVKDLLYYMIHYSDNVAFLMLQDYFGYQGYNEMMEGYGFETFLNEYVKWGEISSHALGYIWTEIYKRKDESEEMAILYDSLVHAGSNFLIWPFTDAGYDYQIAHKSGWAAPGYHDSGIVLSEHPYVIVVMTNSYGLTEDSGFFYNITLKLNQLHDEYLVYIGQEPSKKAAERESEELIVTDIPEPAETFPPEDDQPQYVVQSSVIYWTELVERSEE